MTVRPRLRGLAAALLVLAAPARAADPPASPPATAPDAKDATGALPRDWPLPEGATLEVPVRSAPRAAPARKPDPSGAPFAKPGEVVDASDALDEILDEVAADVARLGAARVSPILVERIHLSPNLNPGVAAAFEARLAAALRRAADATVVRCAECDIVRAEVIDASWVVSRGITRREQAQEIARRYGTRTFLRASLIAVERPPSLALDVELVRADDSAIVYAESYRFGGADAMLYRGADRAQTRLEKLKELEDRLDRKPSWGIAAQLGYILVPSSGPSVKGPYGAIRLDEHFGEGRRHRISLAAGGLDGSAAGVSGGMMQVSIATRVTRASVWAPALHLGGAVGWFLGGSIGSAPYLGANAEVRIATRMGLHASLGYLFSFKYNNQPAGPEIGGIVPEAGVSFLW